MSYRITTASELQEVLMFKMRRVKETTPSSAKMHKVTETCNSAVRKEFMLGENDNTFIQSGIVRDVQWSNLGGGVWQASVEFNI